MDLFATGFNAWGQLCMSHSARQKILTDDTLQDTEEPHDLHHFTKVLSATVIERPASRLTYTIVRQDGCLTVAGLGPEPEELEFLYTSAEAASADFVTIVQDQRNDDSNKLVKYSSLSSWRSGSDPEAVFLCTPPATQIAAFDTGFVILHSDGTVSTFGDSRFEACLGRDVNPPNRPSEKPGPVPDLHNITSPDDAVKRVTAGGTAVAALTSSSGSVYVWGSAPSAASKSSSNSHARRRGHAFQDLSGMPNYTEIDGGKDVADVALGEAHAVALTTDELIYVIGENNNGQLGLGRDIERAETWTNVPFKPAGGYKIAGVAAGPRASFILTDKK
ncbi:regulator of chromosome condensation 1/beta-lactamase-inhibitor protein II [Trichoderma ceciliae]